MPQDDGRKSRLSEVMTIMTRSHHMPSWITSETMVKDVLKPVIFHPAFEGCVPYSAGRLQ